MSGGNLGVRRASQRSRACRGGSAWLLRPARAEAPTCGCTAAAAPADALLLRAAPTPLHEALPAAQAEAAAYAAALSSAADAAGMERAPGGAPRFDLMLIGVGSDGHVGSLYPNNSAVFDPR